MVLIPARSGSKGIRDKNVRLIGNHPLLAYSIAVARSLFPSERIWISTDSTIYAEIGERYGLTVPFLRPRALAGDHVTDFDVFRHAMDHEKALGRDLANFWLHLRPSTPLRQPAVILDAMREFLMRPYATSLRSVHPIEVRAQKWATLDSNGMMKTLWGASEVDIINQPRQIFARNYVPNGYVDVIRRDQIELGRMHGDKCLAYQTRPTPDLDTEADLQTFTTQETADQLEPLIALADAALRDHD